MTSDRRTSFQTHSRSPLNLKTNHLSSLNNTQPGSTFHREQQVRYHFFLSNTRDNTLLRTTFKSTQKRASFQHHSTGEQHYSPRIHRPCNTNNILPHQTNTTPTNQHSTIHHVTATRNHHNPLSDTTTTTRIHAKTPTAKTLRTTLPHPSITNQFIHNTHIEEQYKYTQ